MAVIQAEEVGRARLRTAVEKGETMNLQECQSKAIEENAADSAEFDIVNAGGLRSHCKWEDADFGLFKVMDRPAHLVGKLLHVSIFKGDDRLTVENFTVPRKEPLGLFAVFYDGETRPVAGFVLKQDAERYAKQNSGGASWEVRHVNIVEAD